MIWALQAWCSRVSCGIGIWNSSSHLGSSRGAVLTGWASVASQAHGCQSYHYLEGRYIHNFKTGHCIFLFKPNSEFCQVHMLYSVCLVFHVTFKIRGHLLTLAQKATWTYSQLFCSWNNFLPTTKKSFSGCCWRPSQSFHIIQCV